MEGRDYSRGVVLLVSVPRSNQMLYSDVPNEYVNRWSKF